MDRVKLQITKDSRVLVMGLGVNNGGLSVARFFAELGCAVTITDLKESSLLKKSLRPLRSYPNVRYVLGRHEKEDFITHDIIFQNPAVPNNSPYLQIARNAHIPITNDAAYFMQQYIGTVIGITGTRGKSTTTALLYAMLHAYRKNRVHLAGNIRVGFLGLLSRQHKNDYTVAEFSSWQLEHLHTINKSPHISILTNIYPDHLNRYSNYHAYQQAKSFIFRYQSRSDYLIANSDNAIVRTMVRNSKPHVSFFSTKKPTNGAYLHNDMIYVYSHGRSSAFMSIADVSPSLRCYPENILAAVAAATLCNVPSRIQRSTLRTFRGLPYRMEIVKKYHGTTVINDSCSTAPIAAIYALRSLRGSIAMISGGVDKNVSYRQLARTIAKRVEYLILLPGTGTDKLVKELKSLHYTRFRTCPSLISALTHMKKRLESHPADALLFSPAGASFNLFTNEFDRGKQFTVLTKKVLR